MPASASTSAGSSSPGSKIVSEAAFDIPGAGTIISFQEVLPASIVFHILCRTTSCQTDLERLQQLSSTTILLLASFGCVFSLCLGNLTGFTEHLRPHACSLQTLPSLGRAPSRSPLHDVSSYSRRRSCVTLMPCVMLQHAELEIMEASSISRSSTSISLTSSAPSAVCTDSTSALAR